MGFAGLFRFFRTRCMALRAGRFFLYVRFRRVRSARAVQFFLLVAVKARHSFLVMHVSLSAEISGELGIYAPAVASRTRFSVVLFNELVTPEKPGCYACYLWRGDVAFSARGVATAA